MPATMAALCAAALTLALAASAANAAAVLHSDPGANVREALLSRRRAITDAAGPTCSVLSYGAKGDNVTEDTAAIQAAIDACSPGTVLFPAPGKYLIRPIELSGRSNLNLVISPGASLVVWPDPNSWNASTRYFRDVLWTNGTVTTYNLTITGGGTIDGQGWRWWPFMKTRSRPRLISIENVEGLELSNLTFKDSPSWNTNLRGSFIHVHDMTVLSNAGSCAGWNYAPNTDGFNIGGHDIYIHDSYVHNGDDCIPVFVYNEQDTYNILAERVECHCGTNGGVVIMGDDSCGGASNKMYNITFRDMVVNGTNQGAGMKICEAYMTPKGGLITNTTWSNISITYTRNAPLYINVYNEDVTSCDMPSNPNRTDWLSAAGLTFQDIRATLIPGTPSGCFMCAPESPCRDITYDNVQITNSDGSQPKPYGCYNVQGVDEGGSSPTPCGA